MDSPRFARLGGMEDDWTMLNYLSNAPLGRAISETGGSAAARAEGDKHKAAIVIWGWYGVTQEVVSLRGRSKITIDF